MPRHTVTDFFQAGTTYIRDEPYQAPELIDVFQCEHVATNPRNGEPRAFGFAKTVAQGDDSWYSTALTPTSWANGWVEHTADDQTARKARR